MAKSKEESKAPMPELPDQTDSDMDIGFYKRIGISPKSIKKLFDTDTPPTPGTPFAKLKKLLQDRVQDGRKQSLEDYRIYAAIDEAYKSAEQQITPTLIGKILNPLKKQTAEEIRQSLAAWGLSESTLFNYTNDDKGNPIIANLNKETFWKVLVPLVKSYVTIRQAKLFNDRNNSPFLAYQPVKLTEEDDLVGQIITQLVEAIVNNYGWRATFRQALLQALKYSFALDFPSEAWHCNRQLDDNGKEYTEKEGLRYNIPHPSRVFWDKTYRVSSFNSDTGCEWAGYWRLVKYGDVHGETSYYNQEKITYGTNWYDPSLSGTYFSEVYPCTFPPPMDPKIWGKGNREMMATQYSITSDHDKAIFLTELFCKLKPNKWGLGDYKYDVWFRFTLGNDDAIIWAEPLPYTPVKYLGYDTDESASRSPSMALEVLPWQDLVGNILSQHLLTVRQNLRKIIPYDSDQISADDIKKLDCSSMEAVSATWLAYSSRKARAQQVNPSEMFKPISFGYQDTTTLISTLSTVFTIMERLLVMSASETGATGAHIQTAEEIRAVTTNTSTRVEYTDSFIDDYFQAWKKQIFDAMRAFMDGTFSVELSNVSKAGLEVLKKLGFETKENGNATTVTGDKSKISLAAIISSREGKNRLNNPQIALILLQTVQAVANNPMLAQKIGAEQILSIMSRAAHLSGAPEDFKLKIDPQASQEAQMQQLAEQMQAMQKQIAEGASQMAQQEVAKEISPIIEEGQKRQAQDEQQIQVLGETAKQQQAEIDQLAKLMQQMQTMLEAAAQPQPSTLPPDTMAFQPQPDFAGQPT